MGLVGPHSVWEALDLTLELFGVADPVDGMAAANAEATAALHIQVDAMRAELDADMRERDGAIGERDRLQRDLNHLRPLANQARARRLAAARRESAIVHAERARTTNVLKMFSQGVNADIRRIFIDPGSARMAAVNVMLAAATDTVDGVVAEGENFEREQRAAGVCLSGGASGSADGVGGSGAGGAGA